MRFRYFRAECKRAIKNIPVIAGYFILMSVISFILFTSFIHFLQKERLEGKIPIGIVLPEDEKTTKLAISFATTMDSVSSLCDFSYYDLEEGKQALQKKEIYALVLIPKGMVEDIMSGVNTPVQIVTLDENGIESALFKEFAKTGIDMLGYAQTGIYTMDEICMKNQSLTSKLQNINAQINELYLKYTFSRISLFEEVELQTTGELNFAEYYLCAGCVLLFLLMGIPMAFYFKPHNDAFCKICKMQKLNYWERTLSSYLAIVFIMTIFLVMLYGGIGIIAFAFNLPFFNVKIVPLCIALVLMSVLAFVQMIYEIAGDVIMGIMILFFAGIGMLFVCGAFIPQVFLPQSVSKISMFLPAKYWISLLGNGILQKDNQGTMIINIIFLFLFLMVSCLLQKYREGKRLKNDK